MPIKISQLLADDPADALDGSEGFEVTQGGATKGATAAQIKAFAISEVQAAILALQNASAPSPTGNLLISGGGIAWAGDLDFVVSAANYLIQGDAYTSAQDEITLDAADADDPRIDVIAVDDSGAVVVLTGTPAASPAKPDVDPLTQVELTFILVPAAATEPGVTITADVYHENVEWTTSRNGTTFTLASLVAPHSGTTAVEGTAVATGHWLQFAAPAPLDLAESESLIFWILSKATWPATRSLSLQWRSSNTTAVGQVVTFKHGTFGFDSSITGAYQQIVIPLSLFGANGIPVDRLRLTCAGSGSTIGMHLDDFVLQGGLGSTPALANDRLRDRGPWLATTAYQANDLTTHSRLVAVALTANTNSEPTAANPNWRVLVDFSDVALKGQVNAFTAQQYSAVVDLGLALSGSVALDATDGNVFEGTQTGNLTLANPTNAAGGMTFTLRITIGGAGGYTITWGSAFHFPAGEPEWPQDVGDVIVIAGTYHASNGKWECAAVAPGGGSGGGGSWGSITGTLTDQTDLTTYIAAAIAALVDSSPGTLDTLNELAAALGDDPNFATTIAASIAAKAPLASPALTGTPTAPTAAPGTDTTQIATTAFVEAAVAAAAGGGGGPGTAATAYAQYLAASLEPAAYLPLQKGTGFSRVIGSGTTELLMASWATRLGSAGRMELRNPRGFMPLRGVTLVGLTDGIAMLIDPAAPTYANAWDTYHERLATLVELPVKNLPFTATSQKLPFLPGAYGAIITGYTCFDFAWLCYRPLGSASNTGINLGNEISDTAAQRVGNALQLPVPKKWAGTAESSSFSTGTPLGSISFVLLPSDWSAISDPTSYTFRDDFMGAALDTASVWTRAQTTVGFVEIDTFYQWLKLTGSGAWGGNGFFSAYNVARASQPTLIIDVFVDDDDGTSGFGVVGFHDGAGTSYSDIAHGVNFGASHLGLMQVFENGTSRGNVGSGYTVNTAYRIKIRALSGGGAQYSIQGGAYPEIGGAAWQDITPGTSSSATNTLHVGGAAFRGTLFLSDYRVHT